MPNPKKRRVANQQILDARSRIGPLVFLHYELHSLQMAHFLLGREVAIQVHRLLLRKLDKYSGEVLVDQIRRAGRCAVEVRRKAQDATLPRPIRTAVAEYLECLAAWTRGAALEEFVQERLGHTQIDGRDISGEDLAFMLQGESTGCQTGVKRTEDRSLLFWHTEENEDDFEEERFDKARIVVLPMHSGDMTANGYAFVYPELLPGPAFCWRTDGWVMGVDSLFLRPNLDGDMLSNIVTWVLLRIGGQIPPDEVIQAMGPYSDGYGLVIARTLHGSVDARRLEFAGNKMDFETLSEAPGSLLFQVNLLSTRQMVVDSNLEQIAHAERREYEKRINRTVRELSGKPGDLPLLLRLVSSRFGGEFAYSNDSVKAFFLCQLSALGRCEVWVGPGPALSTDRPHVMVME